MGKNEGARGASLKERMLGVIGNEWMTQREIVEATEGAAKYSGGGVKNALDVLVADGSIESMLTSLDGQRRHVRIYRRPFLGSAPPAAREPTRDVLMRALGPEWMTADEVLKSLPDLNYYTIRGALAKMSKKGILEKSSAVLGGRRVNVYRKSVPGSAPEVPGDPRFVETRAALLGAVGPGWTLSKRVLGSKPAGVSEAYAKNVMDRIVARGEAVRGIMLIEGRWRSYYAPAGTEPLPAMSTVSEIVLAAVGSEWMTLDDVCRACPEWSRSVLRNAVYCLARQGRLEKARTDKDNVYRLAGSVSRLALPVDWSRRESALAVMESGWMTVAEVSSAIDPAGIDPGSSPYNIRCVLERLVHEGLAES